MRLNNSGVIFDPHTHTYNLNGVFLQGITGMISRHLFPNKYDAVPSAILENAARRGERIHKDCYTFDMFGDIPNEEVKWYAQLKESANFEVIDSEYLVTDFDHFASAIDKIITIDGKVYLCDIKTTYALDKDYLSWQLSIYKHLFNTVNPDIEVSGLKAIWIREGATLHDIREIPQEEVKKLLDSECRGEKYTYEIATGDEEKKARELLMNITEIAHEIKRLDELKKDYNEQIEKMFNTFGIEKWDSPYFTISRREAYERTMFDSKRFAADHPEMASEYMKTIQVKESITTKLKTA